MSHLTCTQRVTGSQLNQSHGIITEKMTTELNQTPISQDQVRVLKEDNMASQHQINKEIISSNSFSLLTDSAY